MAFLVSSKVWVVLCLGDQNKLELCTPYPIGTLDAAIQHAKELTSKTKKAHLVAETSRYTEFHAVVIHEVDPIGNLEVEYER